MHVVGLSGPAAEMALHVSCMGCVTDSCSAWLPCSQQAWDQLCTSFPTPLDHLLWWRWVTLSSLHAHPACLIHPATIPQAHQLVESSTQSAQYIFCISAPAEIHSFPPGNLLKPIPLCLLIGLISPGADEAQLAFAASTWHFVCADAYGHDGLPAAAKQSV